MRIQNDDKIHLPFSNPPGGGGGSWVDTHPPTQDENEGQGGGANTANFGNHEKKNNPIRFSWPKQPNLGSYAELYKNLIIVWGPGNGEMVHSGPQAGQWPPCAFFAHLQLYARGNGNETLEPPGMGAGVLSTPTDPPTQRIQIIRNCPSAQLPSSEWESGGWGSGQYPPAQSLREYCEYKQ